MSLLSNVLQFNPLNAELNPICHLLALLGGATIVVVSRLRVKVYQITCVGIIFSGPYGVSNVLKYHLWPYLTAFHIVTMAADDKHAIQGVP